MGTVIGITGTPGTGKKSIAPIVATALGIRSVRLPGPPTIPKSSRTEREAEIDTAKAKLEISRNPPGHVVAYGHLLPYIIPPQMVTRMVVLRCNPMILKERLSERGYSAEKTRENIEAELIGLIANDAYSSFGRKKTIEFDATASSPTSAANAIVDFIQDRTSRPNMVDWTLSYNSASALMSLLQPVGGKRG